MAYCLICGPLLVLGIYVVYAAGAAAAAALSALPSRRALATFITLVLTSRILHVQL